MTADTIRTSEHTLNLTAGVMRVQFRETEGAVFMSITGARPRGFERSKVRRFMLSIVVPYERDRRPMEISGANSNTIGHLRPVGHDGWLGDATPRDEGGAT